MRPTGRSLSAAAGASGSIRLPSASYCGSAGAADAVAASSSVARAAAVANSASASAVLGAPARLRAMSSQAARPGHADLVADRELDRPVDRRHAGARVEVHRGDDLGVAQQALLVGGDAVDLLRRGGLGQPRDGLVGDGAVADQRVEHAGLAGQALGQPVEHPRVELLIDQRRQRHLVGQAGRGADRRSGERGVVADRQLVQRRHQLAGRQRHHAARQHHPRRARRERLLDRRRQRRHVERGGRELHGDPPGRSTAIIFLIGAKPSRNRALVVASGR
jgi:hypothetical protein